MEYRLGIDVGGTNTDAVLLDKNDQVVAYTKRNTSQNIMDGIGQALDDILHKSKIESENITRAMLGTTHCANAVVQRAGLNPVLHLRLAAPTSTPIPPLVDVPKDFIENTDITTYIVSGGLEYDGSTFSTLNEEEIKKISNKVDKSHMKAVSICGIFSPISDKQERECANIIKKYLGENIDISLSSEIGDVGLLERENATILNASLFSVVRDVAKGFSDALSNRGIKAKMYFGQNDGTLMPIEHALRKPVLTIASGPTNSIRGASYLTGYKEAIVVDVGGTTSDIGVIRKGIARQSMLAAEIGGIRTNFRMPDILSIGLGGGTIVRQLEDGTIKIGPDSVGYKISERAILFGHDTLTLTDCAVAKGLLKINDKRADPSRLRNIEPALIDNIHEQYTRKLENAIDRMKTSQGPVPVILVGGGACLFSNNLKGTSAVIRPKYHDVANAIGMAVALVGGQVNYITTLGNKSITEVLKEAEDMARKRAIKLGADKDNLETLELSAIPIPYMEGDTVRVFAKAAGRLAY